VFSSSLYAYGRMQGGPFVESEVPRPRTVYGVTKLAGEHVLAHLAEHARKSHVTLRYLFVYGPRQFAGMGYKSVILKNFERILRGESPTVYGDGLQSLDYVYVDDVVDATIRAMELDLSGETINIGSGAATTVEGLIDRMLAVSRVRLPKLYEAPDWTAGTSRVADPSKAERLLGWRATTTLDAGLERTHAWMQAEANAGAT
jgi:UDP-glucose 4-epimerase